MTNKFILEATRKSRSNILSVTKDFSMEQINEVPAGFSNNIAWNFAHTVVTMQLLTYGLSGLDSNLSPEEIQSFKKGSKPESDMTAEEWAYWKVKSKDCVDQFELDLAAGKFKDFKVYPTSFGVELGNIQDALEFNLIHEGMHFGYVLAMRKGIIKETTSS